MTQTGTPGRNPMRAPDHGVTIRMYRQGHGDCFLLCFRRSETDDTPYFVLIDCGMKGGSEVHDGIKTTEVLEDIAKATGGDPEAGQPGVIDLAIVTHEHEDHVSGFPFGDDPDHPLNTHLSIKALWLAWTEDPDDDDANQIRSDFDDELITLAMAAAEMKRFGVDTAASERVNELLSLEISERKPEDFLADRAQRLGVMPAALTPDGRPAHALAFAGLMGADKPKGFKYKMRLAGLRRHVGEDKISYLDPEDGAGLDLPGVEGVRVYPLGPPRDVGLLRSLDPRAHEEFHLSPNAANDAGQTLMRAFEGNSTAPGGASPFAPRHILPEDPILNVSPPPDSDDEQAHGFLVQRYMGMTPPGTPTEQRRRITADFLADAETLALRLNSEVNNTSLVLLFQLPGTGKTLLFTGDAQRGSWISWADLSFDGQSARDLLGNCVFYKVGHHGSHNATLKGDQDSDHPNLDWLATGAHADEFTAMIPSNKVWAWGKSRPWKHPLPSIEAALLEKAQGRVMITSDADIVFPPPWDAPEHADLRETHEKRTKYRKRYIEHWVLDA